MKSRRSGAAERAEKTRETICGGTGSAGLNKCLISGLAE